MSKQLKTKQQGFTIIEVLIVLAIVGLIILIVFLAVPALQRNSRNTQRKTDVGNIAAAMNEFIANHQGQVPADQAEFESDVVPNAKTSLYTVAEMTYENPSVTPISLDVDNLVIATNARCDPANDGNIVAGGTRNFVALYSIENGTAAGMQEICQEI